MDEPDKKKKDTEVSEESDNHIKESIKKNKKLLEELAKYWYHRFFKSESGDNEIHSGSIQILKLHWNWSYDKILSPNKMPLFFSIKKVKKDFIASIKLEKGYVDSFWVNWLAHKLRMQHEIR